MDIGEFLASGAFVETAQGPHFCQVGKKYVLVFGGLAYPLTATDIKTIEGKETVVFTPASGNERVPVGLVSDLTMIYDIPQ